MSVFAVSSLLLDLAVQYQYWKKFLAPNWTVMLTVNVAVTSKRQSLGGKKCSCEHYPPLNQRLDSCRWY
jgi:hypothetical protein